MAATPSPEAQLRAARLKVTQPRLALLQALGEHGDEHPTAEALYRRLLAQDRAVGLATVYRVLAELEAAGLVQRHQFAAGKARYELAVADPHFHLIDPRDEAIVEFADAELMQRLQAAAESRGYQVLDVQLHVYVRRLPVTPPASVPSTGMAT